MKKLALLALAIPVLAFVFACTDAGDPYIPEDAVPDPTSTDVTITLMDMVGDWDNLHLDGELTGDQPVAMSQDGPMWSATVADVEPGAHGFGVYHDDGTKAMVAVLTDLSVTVSEGLAVSGDTEADLEPTAGTGLNLMVENHNPAFDNIKFKGAYTGDDWATVDRTGMSADGVWVYRHIEAGLDAASYEWGIIHDDGSEWGVWLIEGDNPSFTVDAEGAVTGTTSYYIESPSPSVDVTFAVDMNAETVHADGVRLAGGFGADGYADWSPGAIVMTDDDTDGVYTVTLTLSGDTHYEFKFLNGASWDGEESVPAECGLDDGVSGAYNRFIDTVESDLTYSTAFGACPAR